MTHPNSPAPPSSFPALSPEERYAISAVRDACSERTKVYIHDAAIVLRVLDRLSSVQEQTGEREAISRALAMFGGYAIVCTFAGNYMIVDAEDENAPVARFVSQLDAHEFMRRVLRPEQRTTPQDSAPAGEPTDAPVCGLTFLVDDDLP